MSYQIKVEVFDVPAATVCFSGGWGPSWSPEEITAIVRDELVRRFGDTVLVEYHDAGDATVRENFPKLLDEIESRGLLYPVTVVDGVPLYDGAVSYPAIMRAVGNKMADREAAQDAATS